MQGQRKKEVHATGNLGKEDEGWMEKGPTEKGKESGDALILAKTKLKKRRAVMVEWLRHWT